MHHLWIKKERSQFLDYNPSGEHDFIAKEKWKDKNFLEKCCRK